MSELQSKVNRERWGKLSKEERSARMSQLAKKRMEKLTPLQRKRIARKLVNARAAKRV